MSHSNSGFRKVRYYSRRKLRPFSCTIEALEGRHMLAASPSGAEQEMLEAINEFRKNPATQFENMVVNSQVLFFLNRNQTSISAARTQIRSLPHDTPPLAWSLDRADDADRHSNDMKNQNRLQHSGYRPESVAALSISAPNVLTPFTVHSMLAIDSVPRGSASDTNRDGIQDDLLHQKFLLSKDFEALAVGIANHRRGAQNQIWVTQQFVRTSNQNPFLLGVVYRDANNNGRYNANEGLDDIVITMASSSQTFTTTTTSSGGYQKRLPAGTYVVTASGRGLSGVVSLGTVTIGTQNVKLDLNVNRPPQVPPTGIAGTVFRDTDKDGRQDSSERGLKDFVVFVDANGNGRRDPGEWSDLTDRDGKYRVVGLPPGMHNVRVVPQSLFPTTVIERQVQVVANKIQFGANFGLNATPTLGSVSGIVFLDADRDGRKDPTDRGLGSATVFIDANRNGKLDPAEPSTTTQTNGHYQLEGLPPGVHTVRIVSPTGAGAQATSPNGQVVTVTAGDRTGFVNFGRSNRAAGVLVRGFVVDDRDRDLVRDRGEELANVLVFLDENSNGALDDNELAVRTDSEGAYRFEGMRNRSCAGFNVQIVRPSGFLPPIRVPGNECSGGDPTQSTATHFLRRRS